MKNTVKQSKIRTRFAPSSTGLLHIGSARTALFNYLYAKKNNGVFVLRIEDTDKERSKQEFEKNILDGLEWLGIKWNEGPILENTESGMKNIELNGDRGKYGPYRQSQRTEIYKKYLEKLLAENKAYYCFCAQEELEAERQYRQSRGEPPIYSGKCANLSRNEVEKNLKNGKECIIRFRAPRKIMEFSDLIRGKVSFDSGLIGDFSVAKDINNPLYNFAVVVDDYEMKITHILRGEDLLSNTPKQLLLQDALDFNHPEYGHIPLILAPDRSKMSKRHGATAVTQYKEQGYLPDALLNFIAFLGWNPGTNKEIYTLDDLIKDFNINKIQKGGAIFNTQRLDYINGVYIRKLTPGKLAELCLPFLIGEKIIIPVFDVKDNVPWAPGIYGREPFIRGFKVSKTNEEITFGYIERIVSLYQERLKKLSEISDLTDFFFKKDIPIQEEMLKWKQIGGSDIKNIFKTLEEILSQVNEKDWNAKNLEKILLPEAEKLGIGFGSPKDRGYLLWPFRVALTGKKTSAGPFDIAELLGKEKTLHRINNATKLF